MSEFSRDSSVGGDYDDFLRSAEWKKTRDAILERDNWTCKICGQRKDDKQLVVHHLAYTDDLCNPDYLITVCKVCHTQIHTLGKALYKRIWVSDGKIRQGIDLINEGLTEVIDEYVISRCAELSKSGDLRFFTGPIKTRPNLNNFIDRLLAADPYRYGERVVPSIARCIYPHGYARFMRYQDIRLKRKGGKS